MRSLLKKDGSMALELDSYIVYTLSIADKIGHTEHMFQYLAHVEAPITLGPLVQSLTGPLTPHLIPTRL